MKKTSSQQTIPQEPIIPFENLAEPTPLLWRSAAEQQQHKVITFASLPLEHIPTGPMLDITIDDGNLSQFALCTCWAVMAYPRDSQARDEFLVTLKTDVGARIMETLSNSEERALMSALIGQWLEQHGGFASLLKARGQEHVQSALEKNWWPGSVAGDVLLWIVRLAHWAPPASVNKAVFLEERYLEHALNGLGQHGPSSKRSILAAWKDYKPAAHLWAAFRTWQFYYGDSSGHGPDKPGPDWCNLFLPEGLLGFLGYAEIFRRIGTTLYAHGQSEPVLEPRETWQLPHSIKLPNVPLAVPSLEDWALDALKAYRAEQ